MYRGDWASSPFSYPELLAYLLFVTILCYVLLFTAISLYLLSLLMISNFKFWLSFLWMLLYIVLHVSASDSNKYYYYYVIIITLGGAEQMFEKKKWLTKRKMLPLLLLSLLTKMEIKLCILYLSNTKFSKTKELFPLESLPKVLKSFLSITLCGFSIFWPIGLRNEIAYF